MTLSNEDLPVAAIPSETPELDRLRDEVETLTTAGIIEVAVRNPSVAEYMRHWEGRAEKAEAALEAAIRERDEARARLGSHSEYSIQLQRIIEAVCHGAELRDDSAHLYHHKMVLNHIPNYRALTTSEANLSLALEALERIVEGDIDGEGTEEYSGDKKAVVQVGRSTNYALTLADFRFARTTLQRIRGTP
jgi:hypothetical protein